MADDTIIQPVAPVETKPSRSEERITELSDKVKTEAEGRTKAETEAVEANKRAAFAEGFADILGIYPMAKDHKDDIKTKVLAGYTPEDAALAVLGKAGKLGQVPQSNAQQVAGGSSATAPQSGQKELKDMTQAEKREQLSKDIVWG